MPVYVDFPRICWTPNGSSFVMLSIKDGETALFAVSLINGKLMHRISVMKVNLRYFYFRWRKIENDNR